MNDTTMTLRGRVGTQLKIYRTQSGQLIARFRLAVPRWRITDSGEFVEERTRWYSVSAWDRLAENLVPSLVKGDPVVVVGRPVASGWTDREGNARAELTINAQTVGHDLTKGKTRFTANLSTRKHAESDDANTSSDHSVNTAVEVTSLPDGVSSCDEGDDAPIESGALHFDESEPGVRRDPNVVDSVSVLVSGNDEGCDVPAPSEEIRGSGEESSEFVYDA
ncbi:single-stranded DNA-binding protein [Schaalia sp. ZJ1691]|uniref:single-stranded DNA-binding protein n=1 Tax=Schaalia sp. ZJ1691 TaxID=2709404 RepID=UPI0013EC0928|nr:single-stranded DNA-binding protein [Schaalia sp. ZJ1691]